VTRLNELHSKAIAFDAVFSEPDRTSPGQAIRYFQNLDPALRERLAQLPSNDDVLANAISRGTVVLGQAGAASINTLVSVQSPETGMAVLGPDPSVHLVAFPGLLRNLPQLESAAAGRGLFTIATERDGMIRRVPLIMVAQDKIVPALAVELLRVVSGAGSILVRTDQVGVRNVAVAQLNLPTDENGRVWMHFGRHDTARYVSAQDVLERKVAPEIFSGKLALIGTSAIGLLDVKTTPVHPAMPGVEVHAQLIEAALTNSLLKAPSSALPTELLATFLAGLLIVTLAPILSAPALFAVAAVTAGSTAAGSWLLYSQQQILLDATFPVISILLVYAALALIGYFREQSQRRQIRLAFSQYLSPTLVEQLANSPKKLVLGGEIRNMTILFSDVRGFTSISETFGEDPTGLTALMNRLLTPLTNAIVAHNGTVDKYIGDAIMAFWNAPLDNPSPEKDACQAALDMLKSVDELNREREGESIANGVPFVPIKVGIGLNSGGCIVGNMGSDLRFQYTAMGDTVNLASRLEGQTAFYGVPLLIGARTAKALSGEFAVLEIDCIRVKGKQEAEVTSTILGSSDVAGSVDFEQLRKQWGEILAAYRRQEWTVVLSLIDAIRPLGEKFNLQNLLILYQSRARQFAVRPPPTNWDGVFDAEVKHAVAEL
jgi:adenylate cyclase